MAIRMAEGERLGKPEDDELGGSGDDEFGKPGMTSVRNTGDNA